jgi:hypothetical protein
MRGLLIAIGLLLLIGGAVAFFGVIEYPHDTHSVQVGPLSASVTHEKTVPQWLGGVAALVGAALLAAGALRR